MKTGKDLIKFLNAKTEAFRPESQTVDDWREEHIFSQEKIVSHITVKPTRAKFALVFDDGLLCDLFNLWIGEIIQWARDNGLHMEQYNSWNALFYEEEKEELLYRCEDCGDRIAKGEPCSCNEEDP